MNLQKCKCLTLSIVSFFGLLSGASLWDEGNLDLKIKAPEYLDAISRDSEDNVSKENLSRFNQKKKFLLGCVNGDKVYLDFEKFRENHEIDEKNLVMVSANKHTILGREIQNHPSVKAIIDDGSYFVTVLADVTDPIDRDTLAAASHESIGACGGMQPLSLALSLGDAIASATSTLIPIESFKTILSSASAARIKADVATLEALGSRFHSGSNGALAVSTINGLWQALLPSGAILTETSNGSSSSQNNLILTIPGTSDTSKTLVLGAHLDSINRADQLDAPGADDDASGIATLTEVLRLIKSEGLTFQRNVEFHAYAAEEVGLVGSSTIAKSYAAAGKRIAGQLQIDMNAYASAANQGIIHLVTTDTSAILRRQLKDLMGIYGLGAWKETQLAAGTSDHKSWINAGFHAVFPFEDPNAYNPNIHSSGDQSSKLDFEMSAKFAKLSLAWLAHNAGLTNVSSSFTSALDALVANGNNIKLGIVDGSDLGHRFIVATPSEALSLSSCIVSSAEDQGCVNNVRTYSAATSRSGRSFFEDLADQTLSDGALHRFTAYDKDGVPIAQRTIKLSKLTLANSTFN